MFFVTFDDTSKYLSGFITSDRKAYFLTDDLGSWLYEPSSIVSRSAYCLLIGRCQVRDVTGRRGPYLNPDAWVVEYDDLVLYLATATEMGYYPKHAALLKFLLSGTVCIRQDDDKTTFYLVEDETRDLKLSDWIQEQLTKPRGVLEM